MIKIYNDNGNTDNNDNDDEDITILEQEVNDVNYRTKCDFGEQSRKENKQC